MQRRKNNARHFVLDLRCMCVCVCALWEQTFLRVIFIIVVFVVLPLLQFIITFTIFFRDISVSGNGPGVVPAEVAFSSSRAQLITLPSESITFPSVSESSSLICLLADLDASFFSLEKYVFASDFFKESYQEIFLVCMCMNVMRFQNKIQIVIYKDRKGFKIRYILLFKEICQYSTVQVPQSIRAWVPHLKLSDTNQEIYKSNCIYFLQKVTNFTYQKFYMMQCDI